MTITAKLRDLDLELPLQGPAVFRFRDPRDGSWYDAYMIDVAALTEDQWRAIHADMRSRFPDAPADVPALKVLALGPGGGIPLRADRVSFFAYTEEHARMLLSDDEELEDYDVEEEYDEEDG